VIFLKKALLVSGVFISSLVGAGFASGSEILYYFSNYGAWGFLGIIITVIMFGALQFLILSQSSHLNEPSFDRYLDMIMTQKSARFISGFAHFFMVIIFSAMLSGFGEMCAEFFGIGKLFGVILMLIFTAVILLGGYSWFIKTEGALAVFIVISIIFTAIYILLFRETHTAAFSITDNFATSSLSYVSYNILTTSAVLAVLGKEINKKTALISSFITALALGIIITLLWYIISLYSGMITLGQIPLLTIFKRQSALLSYVYAAVIFVSMLTTAVSNGYILCEKLKNHMNKRLAVLLITISGLFLSGFEFSFIVDKLYRIAGIISIVLVFFIIKFSKKIK